MRMLDVSSSIYAHGRKRERQEGGTAHGVTMPLTDKIESSLRFSKGACLSFVETETAGYHSQMQSATTKGEVIARPPSATQQRGKRKTEKGRGMGMQCGEGPLAFLLLT